MLFIYFMFDLFAVKMSKKHHDWLYMHSGFVFFVFWYWFCWSCPCYSDAFNASSFEVESQRHRPFLVQ